MIRTLALFGARRQLLPIAALTSERPPMLSHPLQPRHLPHWQDSCSKHQLESSRHRAASDHSLTSLLNALVTFQVKCLGTVSGSEPTALTPAHGAHNPLYESTANSLAQSCAPSDTATAFAGRPVNSSGSSSGSSNGSSSSSSNGSSSSSSRSQSSARQGYHKRPRPTPESQQAAGQVLQDMRAAMGRRDYTLVKRLLSPQLAEEVQCLELLLCLVPHVGCPFPSKGLRSCCQAGCWLLTLCWEVGVRGLNRGVCEGSGGQHGRGGGRRGKRRRRLQCPWATIIYSISNVSQQR